MHEGSESVDVVIVGSRCAGSAAAIALARRGRSVVALDGAAFPSDTLSTHLFFPPHWAELERLGARDRVLALDPPLHTEAGLGTADVEVRGPFSAYDGFAAGSCVRRPGLDQALVDTAREAGAEVRERTRVGGLLRDAGGRVAGVRFKTRDGEEGTIRARLVVGADGRGSTVARLVGAREHHRQENRRMMAFAYYRDPREEDRHVAMQWRAGTELVTVFPCDGGLSLILLMPSVDRAPEFREDAVAAFERTVAAVTPLRERLVGCERESKVRVSTSHPSYFRHSHGPGWALAGDAGHFKDPVTAQGIRDALRFGRLLGEAAAPALDDPVRLDAALAAWEDDRDAQCLPMYQWANALGLDDDISPIEAAAYRWFADRPGGPTEVLDVFSRLRRADEVFSPPRVARWVAQVVRDPAVPNAVLAQTLRRDVRREAARLVEARRFTRRRAASAARPPAAPAPAPAGAPASAATPSADRVPA
ncbi:FAD-dependent monooxygenase [Paraconexibacter antarcticus]|uniref:FAD-dependent monooxygenase n=1 Tax=Paraconexibacter antarcticus TaxID=2949664 RepID=A0ABY5DU55_9ACTN|nr:FAD-dependent oxidoreductase [Paraconexibacter antarcticus]UTI64531.1 FAD-dependent monooxygenase [Paraconexibacter antarcticus]